MARPITSVIARNRKRNSSDNFVEFIKASLESQVQSSEILADIYDSNKQIVKNTESLSIIGNILSALTSSMGSLVSVLSKNNEQQKTSAFFAGAYAKEKEYESRFTKTTGTKQPTPVTTKEKEDKGSFFSSLLKWLGGALVAAGTLKWIWDNEEFRTKISNFFGRLFDTLVETTSELYTTVKTWINDEKNQEKIGNFFSAILTAISKGFELVGDLGSVLIKEFEKDDSPLRKTVMGIIDSIWSFIKEHPFIALGAALVTFGGLLNPLIIAIGLVNGVLPAAIAALGAFWGGLKLAEKINNFTKEKKQELRAQHEDRLKEISDIQDPKLKEKITSEIKKDVDESMIPDWLANKPEKMEHYTYLATIKYKDEIEQDKRNRLSAESAAIALGGTQPTTNVPSPPTPALTPQISAAPTGMGPDLDGEVIPAPVVPSVPATTAPTPVVATESTAMGTNLDGDTSFVLKPITETPTKPEEKKPSKVTPTGNAGKDLINKLLAEKGIGEGPLKDYIFGLAATESSFNINARGPLITNPKSSHYGDRAHGLFQIMPNTAVEMGYSKQSITNPEIAAKAGLEYFLKNYKKFGNLDEAVVAHHAGPGRVQEWRKTGKLTGGSAWISNQGYLNKVKAKAGVSGDITTDPVETPEKIKQAVPDVESPFKFNLKPSSIGGMEPTGEAATDEIGWFKNMIFEAMTNQSSGRMTIDKIRAMPRELINAPPKVSGNILSNQSSNLLSSLFKIPEININAPNINQGQKATPSKPPENTTVSIFDKEFIEMLTGRVVDVFA